MQITPSLPSLAWLWSLRPFSYLSIKHQYFSLQPYAAWLRPVAVQRAPGAQHYQCLTFPFILGSVII